LSVIYKFTDQELIDEIHRFIKENNRIPKCSDMKRYNGYPNFSVYFDHFGTWSNVLKISGAKEFNDNAIKTKLINELHKFVAEHGRTPKLKEMRSDNGYPSSTPYIDYFGSFNNALIEAGIQLNRRSTGIEDSVCYKCGSQATSPNWYYDIDKNIICSRCGAQSRKFIEGTLDPTSTTAFGIITEHIVFLVLQDCIKCNNNDSLHAPYDLISKTYNNINVKSSKHFYRHGSNGWNFSTPKPSAIPDYYICIGFDEPKTRIQRVWIIPSNGSIVTPSGMRVYDSPRGLARASQYEVDAEPYNKVYQELDIYTLPEFRNLKDESTTPECLPNEVPA